MRSLTTVCGVAWLVVAGTLAVACGDDNNGSGGGGGDANMGGSGDPGDGGTPSTGASSNTGGKAGSAGAAGSGEGGEIGSMGGTSTGDGGETSSPGGGPSGEGGAGGGGGEPVDPNLCENFPVTVTGGPTIQLNVTGAILCLDPCRVTTNTYSDGEGACGAQAGQLRFFIDGDQSPSNYASLLSDWTWESASAGTIDQSFPYYLNDIPGETEITAVVSDADQGEYTVVFSLPGNGQITITSFSEN